MKRFTITGYRILHTNVQEQFYINCDIKSVIVIISATQKVWVTFKNKMGRSLETMNDAFEFPDGMLKISAEEM